MSLIEEDTTMILGIIQHEVILHTPRKIFHVPVPALVE